MEIVAYRGKITTLDKFIKRLKKRGEITTQDVLSNASIACFKAQRMYFTDADNQAGIAGIESGQITFVNKADLVKLGAEIVADEKPNFKYHALMSNIGAEEVFNLFRSSGVHFTYKENDE